MNYFEEYDKRQLDDISFDQDGYVIFKDVKLKITRENIYDYESQTGMDGYEMVIWAYNNSIPVIRNRKIDEILS